MIDTVIFDVGGVLFANPTEYIKNDVCQSLNLDRAIVDFAWKELIPDLGLGKITEDFFWEKFVKLTNCTSKLPKKSLFVREISSTISCSGPMFLLNIFSYFGHLAMMSGTDSCLEKFSQISSVIKGINGCKSFKQFKYT